MKENPEKFKHFKKKLTTLKSLDCIFVDVNGKIYDTQLCNEIYSKFSEWNDILTSTWSEENGTNNNFEYENLHDYYQKLMNDYVKNDDKELKSLKFSIFKVFMNRLCNYIGCNKLNECSASELGSFIAVGADYEFPGGYTTMINYLADKLPKDAIKLNHAVDKITIDEDKKDNFQLKIKCFNDQVYSARHVIVTCSLNYLKANYKSLFNSESNLFSETKINSMNHLSMGIVNAYCLIYEDEIRFIPDNIDSIMPLFETNNEINDKFETNTWYRKLTRIFKFYDNVLKFYLSGDEAVHTECLSDEEIGQTVTKLFRKMFSDDSIPTPKQLIRFLYIFLDKS